MTAPKEEVSVESEIERTAREFDEVQNLIETISRKVSREGLRRVFVTMSRFPYVGEDAKLIRGEFETELLALCVKSDSLKNTLNVHFKDKLMHLNETANKGENNG